MFYSVFILCIMWFFPESQSMEECGERTKRILDSPSVPRANHQLLAHVTRHLARVALAQTGQHGAASPRLLGQAFSGLLFKPSLFRYWSDAAALVGSLGWERFLEISYRNVE